MGTIRKDNRLIIVMAGALALGACGNQAPPPPPPPKPAPSTPAPTPPPATPAPAPSVATPTPAAAGVTFTSLELGNGVNASGNALSGPASTTFTQKDTIYALVTTNSASAAPSTISARWMFGGNTLVNESNRQLSAAGIQVTEFHVSKPDGWPVGKYSVTIGIDGKQVATKDFEVK